VDYTLLTARSGQDALDMLSRIQPKLILLDIVMPEMDGYSLYQRIRELPECTDTPILFLSCITEHEAEAQGLEMGAADYITKPFNPHIVKLRVRNHLLMKHQQEQLQQKNHELQQERELFSKGPVVSVAWGAEPGWPVRQISSNVVEVLGYSATEILASDFNYASLIHPDDLERVAREVADNSSRMSDFFEQSYRIRLKNNGYRWFYDFTRLERNESGTVTAIRGYMFDQSRLKQAEEAAEAANRAKTEFLNNMSHELRTPLNGIHGMAQLLQFTELSPEQSGYIENIELSVSALTNIINEILDITKLESDRIELEYTVFSLAELLQEVIAAQHPLMRQKQLTMIRDITTSLPTQLIGDPKRIRQVLQNLLSNAVKFTDAGAVTVEIVVVAREPEQVRIRISIRDTGVGMSPEVMQRIFMPFVQADTSTTRCFGGTGLGLTICHQLVELMGGSITVESSPGAGSSFHLEIPFELSAAAVQRQAQTATLPEKPARPLSILIAEDHPTDLRMLELLLRKIGHSAICTNNGKEALERWRKGGVDLILMDIHMPVMTGIEALEAIRAEEKSKGGHLPVIALTADALKETEEMLLKEGFDGYLCKPVRTTDLTGELTRVTAG